MVVAEPSAAPSRESGVQESGREKLIHFFKGRSLQECLASGRDNILHLRLIAALSVVMGHCGLGGDSQLRYDFLHRLLPATYLHVSGLIMFFVISGFLISYSYARHPDLLRFTRARVLRLWPAMAVCAFAVAFVLGPLLTTWTLADYFAPRVNGPYDYFFGNASLFRTHLWITGLFETNPGSKLANGPLWTIPVEATMYLCVAVAGVLKLYRFPWMTSLAIAAIFGVLLLWPMMTGPFNTLNTPLSLRGFFGAGAIAYLLRGHIPISTGLMCVIGAACIAARATTHATPFVWLAITYFVFWFSYVPRLPAIPRDLDLSYAIYLWGWPVQQSIVLLGHVRHPLVLFVTTTAVLIPIALASWLLVEKPALRLKDWTWRRRLALEKAA